jgi:hypothetical protein
MTNPTSWVGLLHNYCRPDRPELRKKPLDDLPANEEPPEAYDPENEPCEGEPGSEVG